MEKVDTNLIYSRVINLLVNNIPINTNMLKEVKSGRRLYYTVVISGNQLKDKNITDVTSIKFTLRAYNLNGINTDY